MPKNLLHKLQTRIFQIPWVKSRWARKYKAVEVDGVPWASLSKPLNQCRLGLVTTAGVHLKNDKPFNMEDRQGDATYRTMPSTSTQQDLMITHDYYDHTHADEDINIVFPVDRLRELVQEGVIGELAPTFFSFMGHIEEPHLTQLKQQTAPEVADWMVRDQVDVAIFTPA